MKIKPDASPQIEQFRVCSVLTRDLMPVAYNSPPKNGQKIPCSKDAKQEKFDLGVALLISAPYSQPWTIGRAT